MTPLSLRTKFEVLASSALLSLGILAGASMADSANAPKYALSLLSGAATSGIGLVIYRVVAGKEGLLRLEIGRLEGEIQASTHRLEEATIERDKFLSAYNDLQSKVSGLQETIDTQNWDLQLATSDRDDWQFSANQAFQATQTLKQQLESQKTAHEQAIASLKKQHGEELHKQVKAKSVAIANRLYGNYEQKRQIELAETITTLTENNNLQVAQYQARISELNAEIEQASQNLALLSEEKRQLADALESLHRQDLPDIRHTFEREWSDNDRRLQMAIEQLQRQYQQAIQPDRFAGIRESARRGNLVIDYFLEQGIYLDARWIDRGQKEDSLYLHYRDLQRNPDILDQLNSLENLRWLQQKMALLADPKFSLDSERVLFVAKLVHSRVKVDAKEIEREVKSASRFLELVKNWRRVRVTGGSESGKSPTAENLACAIAMQNPEYSLFLHNPADISRKNYWSIPAVSTSHKESAAALKHLASMVVGDEPDVKEIHVFDEVDNTMSSEAGASTSIKQIAKQASHKNVGIILVGQNANASNYKGFDRSDFNNLISVHIGNNAFDAIENTNQLSSSEQQKLKATAEKIRDYYDDLNKDFDSETEPEKLYRWAIVFLPGKSPFFVELPMFGKYQYSDIVRNNTENFLSGEALTVCHSPKLEPLKNNAVVSAVISPVACPACGCEELSKNGYTDKAKRNQRYVCKSCGNRFKDTDLAEKAGNS